MLPPWLVWAKHPVEGTNVEDLEDLIEFADNPEPRCPLVLVLDTSGSMAGEPIRELNEGLTVLAQDLAADDLASQRVEIAIVTFGPVAVVQDFVVADQFEAPRLTTTGVTPLGAAVERAVDMVAARKEEYKAAGIAYFRPWIFLITDGAPTDKWAEAKRRVHQGEADRAFSFFAVGVADADFAVLNELAPRGAQALQGLAFRELFQWLSQSQRQVSSSRPGDQVELPPANSWASVSA